MCYSIMCGSVWGTLGDFWYSRAGSMFCAVVKHAEKLVWLLDLVRDRSGNEITYTYERVNNTLYPKDIRYTGFAPTGDPGANRIMFEYEDRPDVRVSYNNTVREKRTCRLQRISVFAGESLARRYELVYEQSPITDSSCSRVSSLSARTTFPGSRCGPWSTDHASRGGIANPCSGPSGCKVVGR